MNKRRIAAIVSGGAILFVFLLMALFPKLFTAYGAKEMFEPWLSPSAEHLFGTNDMGYDVFTEIVYGAREALSVGVLSGLTALVFGAAVGITAAQNGIIGRIFNGLINLFVLLPKLVCLIVFAAFVGQAFYTRVCLIALFGWVGTARAVRAKTVSLKQSAFLENCVVQGYGKLHIALRHVLPNLSDVLATKFLTGVNRSIMMESTLSFLGIGDLYRPTWGAMVNLAYRRGALVRQAHYYLLTPGICISLLVLALYLIGTGLAKHE